MNSGFLTREEVIRTGVSFVFDAYLVDIGEPNNEPLADLTAQGNSCNVVKETGKIHEQQNSVTSNKYVIKGLCDVYSINCPFWLFNKSVIIFCIMCTAFDVHTFCFITLRFSAVASFSITKSF